MGPLTFPPPLQKIPPPTEEDLARIRLRLQRYVEKGGKFNSIHYDEELAQSVHKTCMTIFHRYSYYVGSDGELEGYRWVNFPMRIWMRFTQNDSNERAVIKKITEAFNFILNIQPGAFLLLKDDFELGSSCFLYFSTFGFLCGTKYSNLAEIIMELYSKKKYPELFDLATQILENSSD